MLMELRDLTGQPPLRLGPEPLIGAQRITLQLDGQQRVLSTDGLAPFAVAEPAPAAP